MLAPHSFNRFPGLYGSSNPTRPPEGSSDIDQDTVRRSLDVAEPRPGFRASAAAGGPLNAIAFKQGQLVAITYDTPSNTGALRLYNPALDSWTSLPMNPGSFTIDRPGVGILPDTRFVSANKALYFQSKYGLTKVEDIASAVCRAAVHPKNWTSQAGGSFATRAAVSFTTPGWLAPSTQAAYRFTLARKGANGELIESEPSDRIIVSNGLGTSQNVQIVFAEAWLMDPDMFVRIWRSKAVPVGTDPSDELFLIKELGNLAATNPADATGFLGPNGTHSYVDVTPDGSLYVPLYTNPQSGFGIAQANTPAPLCADMAWFKSRMHYLNTQDVQRLTIKVIGTGTGGIQDGDALTVAGLPYHFKTTPRFTPPDVQLSTGGTVAQNIENTARDLVNVINLSEDNTPAPGYSFGPSGAVLASRVLAEYISGGSADAGQVLIQSVVPGAVPFGATSSAVNGWDRDYTAGATSDPNAQAAGWMWSQINQPEGVPTANNNPIGDPTAAGQRLIALKDTLFAFKQDGLWAIRDDGSTAGPSVTLVDPTIRLVAPETAVAIDNMIFALCDQGPVLITETGGVANIAHTQVERELFKLMAYVGFSTLGNLAFGVAYLPEHTYILALPESPNATSCTKQYVYNIQSRAWTSWNIPGGVLSGVVHPDTGQLYFGRPDGTLAIERKNRDLTDFQDPGFTIASPTATQTKTLIFAGDLRTGATAIVPGDLVQQFQATNALQQRVLAVAYASGANLTTVTLDAAPRYAWNQIVPLTIVKAIPSVIRFLPIYAERPLTDKAWGDCYLSFRYCDLDFVSVGWATEKYLISSSANPVQERVNNADGSAAPIALDKWGAAPWGSVPWGRQARDVVLKATMPTDLHYSAQLTLTLSMPSALSRFELSAVDVKINAETDRVAR